MIALLSVFVIEYVFTGVLSTNLHYTVPIHLQIAALMAFLTMNKIIMLYYEYAISFHVNKLYT